MKMRASTIARQPSMMGKSRLAMRFPTNITPAMRKLCLQKRRVALDAVLFICRLRMCARRRPRLTTQEKRLVKRVHALMLQSGPSTAEDGQRAPITIGMDLFGPGGELEGVSVDLCYCSANPIEMLQRMCGIVGIKSLSEAQFEEIALRVLTHKHKSKGPPSSAALVSVGSRSRHSQHELWEEQAKTVENERIAVTADQLAKCGEILSSTQMMSAVEIAKSYHMRNCEDTFGSIATNGDHAAVDVAEIFSSMSEDGGRTLTIASLIGVLKPHGIREQTLRRAMEMAGVPLSAKGLTQTQFSALMEGLSENNPNVLLSAAGGGANTAHRTSAYFDDGEKEDEEDIALANFQNNSSFSAPIQRTGSFAHRASGQADLSMATRKGSAVSFLRHAKSIHHAISTQNRLQHLVSGGGGGGAAAPDVKEEESAHTNAVHAFHAAAMNVTTHLSSKDLPNTQPSRKAIRHDQCMKSSNLGYTPMMRNSLWRLNDTSAFALDPRTKKSVHVRSRATDAKSINNRYASVPSHVYDHIHKSSDNHTVGRSTSLAHGVSGVSSIRTNNNTTSRNPALSEVLRGGPTAHYVHRQLNLSRPQTASYTSGQHQSSYQNNSSSSLMRMNRPASAMASGYPSASGQGVMAASESLLTSWRNNTGYPEAYTELGNETRNTASAVLSVLKIRERPSSAHY